MTATTVSDSPDPQTCTVLYKILTPEEKTSMPSHGWTGTALDRKDGFIHLSTAHQLAGTLKRFFAKGTHGIGDELSLLGLPRSQLPDPAALKFEPAAGTLFGHVYGPIDPATAFVQEYKLQRGTDGVFPLESLPY